MIWPFSKTAQAEPALDASSGKASFESLVARHYGFVWRVLRGFGLASAEAEDAAQQVFMIAAGKHSEISTDRERSFLYGVTLRVANNARRGLRRRREVTEDELDDAASLLVDPEQSTTLGQARALLLELLEQLPDKLRRALILAELEQLEVANIAELEGIPLGTAASRLRLARQRFRALLEQSQHRNPFASEP